MACIWESLMIVHTLFGKGQGQKKVEVKNYSFQTGSRSISN